MSLLSLAAQYAVAGAAKKFGEHLGSASGVKAVRRLFPEFRPPEPEEDEDDEDIEADKEEPAWRKILASLSKR